MNLNSDDLRNLATTVQKLDGLGSSFSGTLHFATDTGQIVTLEYSFDHQAGRHFLRFPSAE